ncbi:hypothetical protein Peur_013998 [Populus x canadensis]
MSSGTQAACSGVTAGHVSMANIVRMGRPYNKGSQITSVTSYTPQDVVDSVSSSQYCRKPSCDSSPSPPVMHQGLQCSHPSQVAETIHDSHVSASFHDEWPVFDQQTAADGTNLTEDCQLEEVQVSESDAANKNPVSNCAESAFPCRRQENVNSAVGDSCWGDGLLRDTSYDSRRCMNDRWEGTGSGVQLPFPNVAAPLNDEVSSAAADLQQLSLGKEEPAVPPSEDNHAVNPELLVEYLQDEQLGSMSDTHRLTGGVGIHKLLFSPPELMRESIHEVPHGHEYTHPTSIPDSNFKKTQELGFPLGVRIHSKAKNLSSLHMILNLDILLKQASSTSIPKDLLASTIQSSRYSEYAKSSFIGTQSMSSFGSTVSSASNPAISQSEVLSRSAFSLSVSCSPTLPGVTLAPQPTLSQHLSANLSSQPAVPDQFDWLSCNGSEPCS